MVSPKVGSACVQRPSTSGSKRSSTQHGASERHLFFRGSVRRGDQFLRVEKLLCIAPFCHSVEDLQRLQTRSPDQALSNGVRQDRQGRVFGPSFSCQRSSFSRNRTGPISLVRPLRPPIRCNRPLNSETRDVFCLRSEAITLGLASQSGKTLDTFNTFKNFIY